MKLKVIDEYIYRNDYDSIKEPKLKKVYNALASLAKEQNEVDLQAAGEQVSEIKKIKTLKEAIDLLSEKMPQYSKILNYLKNIKFYEDVAITVADNLGNNTLTLNVVVSGEIKGMSSENQNKITSSITSSIYQNSGRLIDALQNGFSREVH